MGAIVGATREYSQPSLLALLEAASASPTASHRIPSFGLIFEKVVKLQRSGKADVSASELERLVAAARAESQWASVQEDWRPFDPRLDVRVRWGRSLYRLLPGSLERPVATVEQLDLLRRVIDPVLVHEHGYGLFDVVELLLRRVDDVVTKLAPCWSPTPVAEIGDRPTVSQAEVDAAALLSDLVAHCAGCSSPERARRALERHCVEPVRLRCRPTDPVSSFGPVIGVRPTAGQYLAIPAGVLMESLEPLGAALAAEARRLDPSVEERWAELVRRRVGYELEASGHRVLPVLGSDDVRPLLVMYGPRQVLAISVVAALTSERLENEVAASGESLGRVVPGATLMTPQGTLTLSLQAQVADLQVIAAPKGGAVFGSEYVTGFVEDVLWFARTARDPSDLWFFVQDLDDPHSVDRTFFLDLIDPWEFWRSNGKSFYRGGKLVSLMTFGPHEAKAEWEAAAEATPIEEALLRLRLPPRRAWPLYERYGTGNATVGDRNRGLVYRVLPWATPVAVRMTSPEVPDEHDSTCWKTAEGLVWKLDHAKEAFLEAASASQLRALTIELHLQEDQEGPPLRLVETGNDRIVLGWDSQLQEALLLDSSGIEMLAGTIVAEAFTQGARAGFVAAWNVAPPGVRVDAVEVPQRAQRLPAPISAHDSLRSRARRRLGEHLMAEGIEADTYSGAQATSIESRHIYSWLIDELHRLMAPFDLTELLVMALGQLERANCRRRWLDWQRAWTSGFPVHADEEEYPSEERVEAATRVVRVISLIVEEILASSPTGQELPDDFAWSELVSVGELCLESCFRSEATHVNLVNTNVVVTDFFEVEDHGSEKPTDIDFPAYARARASATRPTPIPIGTDDPREDEEGQVPRPFVDAVPELAEIDASLKSSLGWGLDALIGVLNVARQWDASPDSPATRSTAEELVERTLALAVGATQDEYQLAVAWLTLRATDLRDQTLEHWESERRPFRITTRPLVDNGGEIFVLPWSAEMSMRVLVNYLQDGRLPWPDRVLPDAVVKAVDKYRQGRNRELERECLAELAIPNLRAVGPIKPEKAGRYGIKDLKGEVDAVALDERRSRIWVIEAKDPYTPFSHRQVRRLVDDFHKPGRYVDTLLKKVDVIRASAAALASSLGIAEPDRVWTTLGLMVTRHEEPAAYAVSPTLPFCTVAQLSEAIDRDEGAPAGAFSLHESGSPARD